MGKKLLLSNAGFPQKFLTSSIIIPPNFDKQQFIENKVLESINKYNPKLNVTKIEYLVISSQFPNLDLGIYAGLIVEDIEISENQKDFYLTKGCHISIVEEKLISRKILVYVFLTNNEENGRDIISQYIFPEIIDFMGAYYTSPSFEIVNHPIYFVNIFKNRTTASSIIKQIAGMIASNIEYIEVFNFNSELSNIPKDIYEYIKMFEKDFDEETHNFKCDFYEIDFIRKTIIIKVDRLVLGNYIKIRDNSSIYQFKGSSEKFYWAEVLPISILAQENGYKVDLTLLENFYKENKDRFSEGDTKMKRFSLLIKFINKLTLRRNV